MWLDHDANKHTNKNSEPQRTTQAFCHTMPHDHRRAALLPHYHSNRTTVQCPPPDTVTMRVHRVKTTVSTGGRRVVDPEQKAPDEALGENKPSFKNQTDLP